MANSIEEEKETQQVQQNPELDPVNKSPEQNTSRYKSNFLMSGVAIVIAIVAIVVALGALQSNYKIQKTLAEENNLLKTEVEQLKQTQMANQDQVDANAKSIQQSQSTLQDKFDHLNKRLQVAMNQRLYQNQDWLLLKARYYLELAQINSHWSDNYNAAISLLQQADKLLEQLHAPKIFEVRQAIAKEIAQFKALPAIDIAGLLGQLDAAQISVSNLTIQATIDENETGTTANSETPKTANPSAWKTRFQDSVNLLEKLVVIRREDEQVKPLMSPLFESILRESIRLNLQEAQWAVLNSNPVVYQLAMKQATMNLKRTFNQTSPNIVALLKQLNELEQVKITQEKPTIELALPLLNQMIDNKELLVEPVNNSEKGEH